jgi:hypothetical protein
VTINDAGGASTTASSTATIADAPLSAAGVAISATAAAPFSGAVATFTDADPNGSAAQFSASIDWGDGKTSAGTISATAGGFTVSGSHTYAAEGSRAVGVTINDAGGASSTASSTATIADAPLSASGVAISATAAAPFSGAVATFTDADPNGSAAQFSATIAWGDGKTTTGTIGITTGGFTVSGTHTYMAGGNQAVGVAISDIGGATATAVSTATVAASHLVVTTQPTSLVAGNKFTLKVTAEDTHNAAINSYTGPVTVSLAGGPAGATLGGTLTVNAVNGVATFSTLALTKAGLGYTIQASASGLLAATSAAITVTPAAATELVVSSQPPASVVAGNTFVFAVTATDKYGNTVPSYQGPVTVSLSTTGTLGGTLTVNAMGGVATFSDLFLTKAGTGYKLKASAAGGPGTVVSNTLAVAPNVATHLVVTLQPPASVVAGNGLGMKVTAEDAYGNAVKSYTGPVTVSLAGGPAGAALGGTLTVNAASGVASFSALILTKAGSGYTIQASGGGLATATSSAITVTPAAASKLIVLSQPPASVTAGSPFGFAVEVVDKYGNVVTGYTGSVTLALVAGPAGATLGGTLTINVVNGVATFSDLSLSKAGTGYKLKATAGTLSAASSSFNVN